MAKADSEQIVTNTPDQLRFRPAAPGQRAERTSRELLLEVAAALARPGVDIAAPDRVCSTLYEFAVRTRDSLRSDESPHLWQFAARLVDSQTDPATESVRAFRFADWAVRELLPFVLESGQRSDDAKRLHELDPIVNQATAQSVYEVIASLNDTGVARTVAMAARFAFSSSFVTFGPDAQRNSKRDLLQPANPRRPFRQVAIYAAIASINAEHQSYVHRDTLVQMRLALLDQLCPAPAGP